MDSPPPSLGAVECRHFPPSFSTRRKEKKRRRKMFILHLWGQGQRRPRILFLSLSKNESGYRSTQPLHFPHLLYYFYLRSLYSAPAPPELHYNSVGILHPLPLSTKHFLELISSIFMRGGERQVEKERENGLL